MFGQVITVRREDIQHSRPMPFRGGRPDRRDAADREGGPRYPFTSLHGRVGRRRGENWLHRLGPWLHGLSDPKRNELSQGFPGHEARIHVLKRYCQGVTDTGLLFKEQHLFVRRRRWLMRRTVNKTPCSIRFAARSQYRSSISTPTALHPASLAARRVLPLPMNGSRTICPSAV